MQADIAVGVYALRTFRVMGGRLYSVYAPHNAWDDGVCEAKCLRHEDSGMTVKYNAPLHTIAPHPDCLCGIYGSLSLDLLHDKLSGYSHRLVAVIAAEGETIIGSLGLRTQYARIVAYYLSPDSRLYSGHGLNPANYGYAEYEEACGSLGATRFYDAGLMAESYGLAVHCPTVSWLDWNGWT